MKKIDYNYKRIADPIHGTIGLSELEVKLLNSSVFQRLRNIWQLGLVHFVFPAVNFSRLSHSLGTCYLIGLAFDALKSSFDDEEEFEYQKQIYRLAALCHDIGHYPFSHLMENALKEYYSSKYLDDNQSQPNTNDNQYLSHEEVGGLILKNDGEIAEILKENNISAQEVSSIFAKFNLNNKYSSLISSDLDVDRLDYLLRTSHFAGLPYGNVDVDYLLSQLKLTKDGAPCFSSKAIKAIDHYLLSRYFKYQQIIFHKTVVGMEQILMDIIQELLKTGKLNCSKKDICAKISNGEWNNFDDIYILNKIREFEHTVSDRELKAKIHSVLFRKPPQLVYSHEVFELTTCPKEKKEKIKNIENAKKEIKSILSEEFGISSCYIWSKQRYFIKQNQDQDTENSTIFIEMPNQNKQPIFQCSNSLTKILSNYMLSYFRVYIIAPESKPIKDQKKREIEQKIKKIMCSYNIITE